MTKRNNNIDYSNVIEMYNSGLSTYQIADKLGCSRPSISTYLKNNNIQSRFKRCKFVNHSEVAKLYKSGMTVLNISKKYNIDKSTVHSSLNKSNIIRRSKIIDLKDCVGLYKSGVKIKDIAKKYSCSISFINRSFKRNKIKFNRYSYEGIIDLYKCGKSITEIVKMCKINENSVIDYLKSNGIEFNNYERVVDLYQQGKTILEIAKFLDLSVGFITRKLRIAKIKIKQPSEISSERRGNKSKIWTGYKNLSGLKWNSIKNSANSRDIPLLITIEDAWKQWDKQNGLCVYTGKELTINSFDKILITASLDRIDSNKSYTCDNIQWIDKTINRIKWKFSHDYFLKLCSNVGKNLTNDENFFEERSLGIKRYLKGITYSLKKRPKAFDINENYVSEIFDNQKRKCAFTNLPIFFKKGKFSKEITASVDRIDSSLGYIQGNIQVVHKDINRLKWTLSQEDFLSICKTVTNYQKIQNV